MTIKVYRRGNLHQYLITNPFVNASVSSNTTRYMGIIGAANYTLTSRPASLSVFAGSVRFLNMIIRVVTNSLNVDTTFRMEDSSGNLIQGLSLVVGA